MADLRPLVAAAGFEVDASWRRPGFYWEAARQGVKLRALRAHARADVDMTRALGVNPPVRRIDWTLEVDASADAATLDAIKALADEHGPGVYCLRNPIELHTQLGA